MKSILLIGLGRFGRHIAEKLYELNHQILAIDKQEDRVEAVLPFVTSGQIGDSTNIEFLQSLGIGKQLLDFVKSLKGQLKLNVYQKNERAIKFYTREQFEIQDEQTDEATGEAEYLMLWKK